MPKDASKKKEKLVQEFDSKNLILEIVETLITSFVIIVLIYAFVASIEVVSGSSMEPNYETGERILVEKLTKHVKSFERGEVIVLTPPGENRHYLKRIVGIPGDIVKIFECEIYISNDGGKFVLNETYLSENTCTKGNTSLREGRALRLRDNEYIVLGDNRKVSIDSRAFGVVSKSDIVGRVVFRFWPTNKLGFLN